MQQSVLALYRALLKEGAKFPQYNVRKYVQRRVREEFQKHKEVSTKEELEGLLKTAEDALKDLQRQSAVYKLYARPLKNIMDLTNN